MKVEELRIGNKLYWEDKIVEVVEIHKDCFYVENSKYGILKSTVIELKPIELNLDIFKEYGFKGRIDFIWNQELGITFGTVKKNRFYLSIKNRCGAYYDNTGIELKYLHQLQNIYFSILNKEMYERRI